MNRTKEYGLDDAAAYFCDGANEQRLLETDIQ